MGTHRYCRELALFLVAAIAAFASSCGGARHRSDEKEKCEPVTFDVGVRLCPPSEDVGLDDLRALRDEQARLEKLHGGELSVRVDGVDSVEFLVGATKDELLSALGSPDACQREMFENELPFTGNRISMVEMLAGKKPEADSCAAVPVWVYDFGFVGVREAAECTPPSPCGNGWSWSIFLQFDEAGTCTRALKFVAE
jgi:hypothetical protein